MILHGIKNVTRSVTMSISIVLILSVSIGLVLIMFFSYRAINEKISNIKSSIGNTITINPAGSQGFEGGGNPITETQINEIKNLPNIVQITEALLETVTPGSENNLISPIKAGILEKKVSSFQNQSFYSNNPNFSSSVPIVVTGTSNTSIITGGDISLISGNLFNPSSNDSVAIIGKNLALKNNLKTGDTFTLYNTKITVSGVINMGTRFANDGIYMPILTLQNLSGQQNDISTATITVNSITNVNSVISQINSKLGPNNVDITSSQTIVSNAIAPLESIKNISLYSLIGALSIGSVIILLIMIMTVKERKKEFGVLKAIGASSFLIITEFVSESLTLTIIGTILGIFIGILLANPVLSTLVNTSTDTSIQSSFKGTGISTRGIHPVGPLIPSIGGGVLNIGRRASRFISSITEAGAQKILSTFKDIHAIINLNILLYGILVALIITALGSVIPILLISKVSPAEIIRGE